MAQLGIHILHIITLHIGYSFLRNVHDTFDSHEMTTEFIFSFLWV